ncbi:MAG TPA: YhjD/YihY/BrkB family envelope integrity protein [Acidimicrobiales bacterium]|jgi:uncharacterized BrkB/YihY/UPF0761 family membrane protein|nr:YhjD/YihY/BrkB family envelope integrity protein [Acidimicrobiales bacterium]
MKQIQRLLVLIDGWQRMSRPLGLVYAVIKKFGDDDANQFVVALGWYGFVAIYPLLLVVITIFGFIGAASLGHRIVSTLHEFPVIGSQFNPASSQSLRGSGLGLAIGLIGSIYGAQGVTQTVQQAMAGVWNVPQVDRPGFGPRLARSLVALVTIGSAFVLNAVAGTFVTSTSVGVGVRAPALVGMVVLNAALYFAVFRVATPSQVATRDLLPGAALASVGFTLLITIGSGLVQHQLRHSSAVYGQFGLVIGLVGFLFLLAKISLYGAELNPVVSRRLWPRGMLDTNPTAADNQVLSDIAHQYRRRDDQCIGVGFGENAADDAARDARGQIRP